MVVPAIQKKAALWGRFPILAGADLNRGEAASVASANLLAELFRAFRRNPVIVLPFLAPVDRRYSLPSAILRAA